MKTCGSCKFWGGEEVGWQPEPAPEQWPDEPQKQYSDRRDAAQAANDYRTCQKVVMVAEYKEDPPLAYTIDGSKYIADLRTLAEFGCVLHEEIPSD